MVEPALVGSNGPLEFCSNEPGATAKLAGANAAPKIGATAICTASARSRRALLLTLDGDRAPLELR